MSEPRNNLTGRRFGRLTVLGYSGERGTRHYWKVRCDCGTERVVYAQSLRGGLTKSCGCAKPVPSAGRRPKVEKAVTLSELVELPAPVGDDWMFGHRGGKGLFVTRRVI